MSKPTGNDFSTNFWPERQGVEITSITTTINTDKFGTDRFTGIQIYLDVTIATTPTLDVRLRTLMPSINGQKPGEGQAVEIAAFNQIVANSQNFMGFVSSGNATFALGTALAAGSFRTVPLGQFCDILLTFGGTGSFTVNQFSVILVA